ncbi:bactofilin family protein [Sulfuriflexus mobilis]|uniref:bactofilin family protein n=1 Tax=Sulfuriflexus mobilis TaxID=1811807 RepID=UPI0015585863|nr:polymer-forming cytoskeletal protein [Sulfuriflexus mobilis]
MTDNTEQPAKTDDITAADVVHCMIGKGVSLRGDMDFSGGLHVDGNITGNLEGHKERSRLTLSREGTITGNISVGEAEINGTIVGDVHASGTVTLHPQSHVTGNVYYGKIEIRSGARISGKLIANNPQGDKGGLLGKLSRKSA